MALAAQLVTAYTIAYALVSPAFVAILPAHRQRFGLLLALSIFIFANIASALATNFAALVAYRAAAGIGAGAYLALGNASAVVLSGQGRRGRALAIVMGGMASGTVLGVPLSLLLAQHFGWQIVFWLIAGMSSAAFLGLLFIMPSLPVLQSSSLRSKLAILADRRVVTILFISLLAAAASLGMYTFIAPFMMAYGTVNVVPYLWVWGVGGVFGSFLSGPLIERIRGPVLTFIIMLVLALSLFALPLFAVVDRWLVMLPIAIWGLVGWALQIPQNHELILSRQAYGDGNLAVSLNGSALYLGSSIGAAAGGVILSLQMPVWILAASAGSIATIGVFFQAFHLWFGAKRK